MDPMTPTPTGTSSESMQSRSSYQILTPNAPPVSIVDWLVTYLILMIPLLNIIMLFVWAFSSDTNPSKANFAKAYLILFLIVAALSILFILIFGAAIWTAIQEEAWGSYQTSV